MENEVKLKIEEWELLVQVKILDPDGFDRTNPNLFNEKFTYKEFKKGMDCSTQKSMTHEEWTSQYERLLDSNKHEPQVIASERSSANGAVADIVLTIQEIYNLAVYAGLVINEKNSTDDRESEIAIKENMTIKMSDGEWKGRGAYYTDYPEDKAVIIKEY